MDPRLFVECQPWWDFAERSDVKEQFALLSDGLVHPVDYARRIFALALEAGLISN